MRLLVLYLCMYVHTYVCAHACACVQLCHFSQVLISFVWSIGRHESCVLAEDPSFYEVLLFVLFQVAE